MSLSAAITGRAWRTALGSSVDDVLHKVLLGQSAARANPRFDARSYACTLAAAIDGEPAPSRHSRFLRRLGLFALEVASEAMSSAGLVGSDRVGLFFGYGGLRAHWNDMMPALEHQAADGTDCWERGFKLLHPFWMLQHLSNNAQALTAQVLQARGEGVTFGGANAGAQAIVAALAALELGAVDAAVVVAHDTLLEAETLVELGARGAVSFRAAAELVAPYASGSSGFVPGEAAAALVLQRSADAGPRTLAVLQAADGADGQSSEPAPQSIRRLVQSLVRGGEVVDGAGRALPALDQAERLALGECLRHDTALCCSSSALGQVGAAGALVQAIFLTEVLRRGFLPPIAGLGLAQTGPLRPLTRGEPTDARCGLGISTGAPGLVGVVRVEVK